MNDIFHYRFVSLLFVMVLVVTSCDALGNVTGNQAEPVVQVVTATEETTETSKAPPRMPPPGIVDTAPPAAESTTAPVASTGDVALCKLPARVTDDPYQYQLLGIPRPAGFAPSAGTVEVAILFVDYSDARATSSPEQELGLLSPFALSQYFSDVSYGQMELVIKPYSTWINLDQPASYYRDILRAEGRSEEVERDFLQDVVNFADPNVDFSNTDILLVIANPQASDDFQYLYIFSTAENALGVQADGATMRSGVMIGSDLLNPDLAESYRNNSFARNIASAMSLMYLRYGSDVSEDVFVRASSVGVFSIMGWNLDSQRAPGMFAFERWQLGWMDDGQIVCQTGGEQTTDLSAIEQAGGTKAVMIPLGERSALVVESRRATGTDQDLVKEGALVYTVDTSVERNGAPIRVLPAFEDDLYREQSPLAQGESITHCNITITNVAAGAEGDMVNVSIPDVISCAEGTASTTDQVATPDSLGGIPTPIAACSLDAIPAPTQADVTVRFVNQSGFEGVGFWQDASQSPIQEAQYFNVANSGTYNQESFKGDKWVVKEPSGGVLMEYTASDQEKQCVLIKRPLGTLWVDFVNESGIPAIGYLVNADGSLEEYFRVGVGGTTGLWTAPGITWRILDSSGNTLLEYTSTNAPEQRVVIPRLLATRTPRPAQDTPVPTSTAKPTATSPAVTPIAIDPATNCPIIAGATSVVCYDIVGSTEDELVASMKARTPAPHSSYTDVYYTWNWNGYGTNTCDLSSAIVNIATIEVTLPRWNPPASASPQLVTKWEQNLQNLAIRHQARVDFYSNNYLEIRTAIQNATCSTADAEAQNVANLLGTESDNYADQIQPRIQFP